MSENPLDNILVHTGGFGKYQQRITVLISIIVITTYFSVFAWLFEAKQINHRCEIDGCESSTEFKPSWWSKAIPSRNQEPAQCLKYKRISNQTEGYCNNSDFSQVEETCDKYVYETNERSIVQDFNLHCEENLWKLTFVGSVNSFGTFVGLPISGILSDKYGRKIVLIGTTVLTGVAGLIRSFSQSYVFFIVMEFVDAVISCGAFPVCFILALELVGPEQRALLSTLIAVFYSIGGIFVGLLAWLLQTWRPLVRILYGLLLLFISYHWLIPESVRWLLTQKKYVEAVNILQNLAKTNGKVIPEEHIKELCYEDVTQQSFSVKDLFKSVTLTMRFINCSLCWLISIFVYQGLTIYSVDMSGNSYLDYILTIVIEVPGSYIAYLLMDSLGRVRTLAGSLFVCSISCVAFFFITTDLYWLRLCLYLIGKLGITVDTVVIYPLTSEMFPTPLRNSLLSGCSMLGRIGAIVSPQVILLAAVWKPLPIIIFAITSLLAGGLALLFPETKNTKLPDTIIEAEYIGKANRIVSSSARLREKDEPMIEYRS